MFALACALAASGAAQNAPPEQGSGQLPVKPPPIPTGVIPLPQGPPPTSPQAPVPKPVRLLPKALEPLAWSPDLPGLKNFVSGQPITLQDAVAIALYTNRNFASSVATLEQASARAGEAADQLMPNLGINGNLTEFDAPTVVSFGTNASGKPNPPITIVPQFNPVFTASVTMPLDVLGTLHSAISQAQFQEVAAKIDVSRVRNQVVYDVKTAFYNVLRSQAQLAVATNSLNNALFRLSDANKNYAAGSTSRYDVITAQRDVADAQQAVITAHAQVTVNLAALKNTMGLDLGTRLSITDAGAVDYPPGVLPPAVPPIGSHGEPLETPAPSSAAPGTASDQILPQPSPTLGTVQDDFDWGPEFPALIQEALRQRPEVLEAEAQVTANRKGLQYARRSSLPSFNLSLTDQYTPNATAFTRKNEGIFALGFTIPIFDGGLARDRVREQRAGIAQAEISRRQAADQVQFDVQEAYLTLVQARQRVAVANVEVSQARETFRVSRVRYRAGVSQQAGVSPQLELSNAQISLAQAESNQVNALYDYNNARAQLDRALGRYGFTGLGPGYGSVPGPRTTGQAPIAHDSGHR